MRKQLYMEELSNFCRWLKKNFVPKPGDHTRPARCWSEKDFLDNRIVDAFVIVLKTRGCSWALNHGCTMCGYFNESTWKKLSEEDLFRQFETAMEQYNGEKIVKIYTSGSFLDNQEIKPVVRKKILQTLTKTTVEMVSVETRPEYVSYDQLEDIKKIFRTKLLEISIGLETANDFVRKYSINKGFTLDDYKKAADMVKKNDFRLKTYLLIKPPFLTEKESILDSISSVKKIMDCTDTISFNPVNVQRNTVVEYLWRRNEYRPPWLWSIAEILKKCKKLVKDDVRIKCDVAGGGKKRGAHNCGRCDRRFLSAIASFSLNQKEEVFDKLECRCREVWYDQLEIENLSFGSLTDNIPLAHPVSWR